MQQDPRQPLVADHESRLDFVYDGPWSARPSTERARIVQLQAMIADVLGHRTPVSILVGALEAFHGAVEQAIQHCYQLAYLTPARADFFDTSRIAYLHAREAVSRMLSACEDGRWEDWLAGELEGLESAAADIDALVSLEAEGTVAW